MSTSALSLAPQSTTASLAVEDSQSSASATTSHIKSSRQRFKPQLSCTLCRTRKLKCDRNRPCHNCVKRDLSSTCTYKHAGIIGDRATHVQKTSSASAQKDVQGRIRHLEELVVTLMQSTAGKSQLLPPKGGTEAEPQGISEPFCEVLVTRSNQHIWGNSIGLEDTAESFGRISMEDEQPNYVGGSHWAAILDSIAGLKESLEYNEWSAEDAEQHTPVKSNSPDLLVGSVRKASKAEILASIPPKPVADLLVGHLLRLGDIAIVAVHSTTFKQEYEHFWIDPEAHSIIWIGFLYAIMCLGLNIKLLTWDKERNLFDGLAQRDPREMMLILREKTVQCLVLSNYTEPTTYTVETLLTYALSEYFTNPEGHVGGWMVMGLAVRAALRLGYHRDPPHSSKLSVFRSEMQRRIWCILVDLDISTSSSVGLPRMIQESMCDTHSPSNLYDEDFNEQTTVLPPSRPDDKMTPIGYIVVKHNIMMVNGAIIDQANSISSVAYEDVMRLDRLLHLAKEKVPEALRVARIEDLQSGPPDLRVRKFLTSLVFEKARCILHRKFFLPPKSSTVSPFPYSTKSCVDSAMLILQAQALLYVETKPGQALYEHKWKTTALMTQDFLLAAMLVCLFVCHPISEGSISPDDGNSVQWTRGEMLRALEYSFNIWDSTRCSSKEALKAAKALKAMLSKIRADDSPAMSTEADINPKSANTEISSAYSGLGFAQQQTQFSPEPDSGAVGSSVSLGESLNTYQPQPQPPTIVTSYDLVGDMMNAPIELDWELWDNHFSNNNYFDDTPPNNWDFPVFLDPNSNVSDWGYQR